MCFRYAYIHAHITGRRASAPRQGEGIWFGGFNPETSCTRKTYGPRFGSVCVPMRGRRGRLRLRVARRSTPGRAVVGQSSVWPSAARRPPRARRPRRAQRRADPDVLMGSEDCSASTGNPRGCSVNFPASTPRQKKQSSHTIAYVTNCLHVVDLF